MSKLVTDINFYPNEIILKLEDGELIHAPTRHEDGTQMTLDELRAELFLVEHKEIYYSECGAGKDE